MSRILAIDPGPERSAFLQWSEGEIIAYGIEDNLAVLNMVRGISVSDEVYLAIEGISSYGMPVGKETFETCYYVGKCCEAFGGPSTIVLRRDIKLHFCQNSRAKDANIRQALIDRFGVPGTKKRPGKLYGITKDIWSALAISVYFNDKMQEKEGKDVGKR